MKANPDSVSVILSQQKQPVSAMFSDSLLHRLSCDWSHFNDLDRVGSSVVLWWIFSTCCSPDRPSAAVHGNEHSVRISFWTFSRSSADFWWKANHLMCRPESLRATASSLHVNDLNLFSVRGQINQSDRCCGPHDAAVRAFCSVVTCLCQSLAPDIFAFLLWDSERCRCVQHRRWRRRFAVSSPTVSDNFFCYEWTKEKNSPKRLDSGRWSAHSPVLWQQRPSFWWNSVFEAHLPIT